MYVAVDIEGAGGAAVVPRYSIVILKVMFDCFCIIRYEEWS